MLPACIDPQQVVLIVKSCYLVSTCKMTSQMQHWWHSSVKPASSTREIVLIVKSLLPRINMQSDPMWRTPPRHATVRTHVIAPPLQLYWNDVVLPVVVKRDG